MSLRRCTAPGARPRIGARRAGERRLAGAREAADGNEAQRSRGEEGASRLEIANRAVAGLGRAVDVDKTERVDLGAHGRTQRQEERQEPQSGEFGDGIGRAPQIAIEEEVRLRPELPFPEVHEQEGEIVEDVGGGNRLVELDGVEEDRLGRDQDDVAKMKVAMNAADPAVFTTGKQERLHARLNTRRIASAKAAVGGGKHFRRARPAPPASPR